MGQMKKMPERKRYETGPALSVLGMSAPFTATQWDKKQVWQENL